MQKERYLKMSDEQLEEMINEITKGQRFIKFQISQIKSGLECGLSMEQVQVYAKPKYNFLQMEQIRLGFEQRLSEEQVQMYTDSEFACTQMEEIREGIQNLFGNK